MWRHIWKFTVFSVAVCQIHFPSSQNAVEHPVRLVGDVEGEGRVEVWMNGTWNTVCDTSWDQEDARVVCRQLGYPGTLAMPIGGAFFGQGLGAVGLDSVACTGMEPDLFTCPATGHANSPVSCSHVHDAGVLCDPLDVPIRLSGEGSSLTRGRVEVKVNGVWGTVCDNGWGKEEARVVCSQLGFHSARATPVVGGFFGAGFGRILMDGVACTGRETHLVTCPFSGFQHHTTCSHGKDAGVICNPEDIPVRLVGEGTFPSQGRVEIQLKGDWGTICDAGWDHEDAEVVCRQLGFNSSQAFAVKGGLFGETEGAVYMDQVDCKGGETHLALCPSSGFDHHPSCSDHQTDAGVMCQPRKLPVRLVGDRPGEGRVEVKVGGQWGTVCDTNWDAKEAMVVCSQLGFTSSRVFAFGKAFYGAGTGPILMDRLECQGSESHLAFCTFAGFGKHTCTHNQDAGVNCLPDNFPLRLMMGATYSENRGRVEMRINGTWGSVCDSYWTTEDAEVACRQMGVESPYPVAVSGAYFGQGIGRVHMEAVKCTGTEDHLAFCPSTNLGEASCFHQKDAGVICQPEKIPVQLVGGSLSEGRVEVNVNGQWGTVCDTYWDQQDAEVVCRQLGFNSSLVLPVGKAFFGEGTGGVAMTSVNCVGNEPHVTLCPFAGFNKPSSSCTHANDAGVICDPLHAEVRLAGNAYGQGRMEVKINGDWSSVCGESSYWGTPDATVVCRQLGFENTSVAIPVRNAFYGEGDGTVALARTDCVGTESHVLVCPTTVGINHQTCSHQLDVGVVCVKLPLRLVGGSDTHEGRVEVKVNAEWSTVCDSYFGVEEAQVVCRQLGFNATGARAWPDAHFGEGTGVVAMTSLACTGKEDFLTQCPMTFGHTTCAHSDDAGVTCVH